MKFIVRISLVLSLCIIFSRIVYLVVSPVAYIYIDRKEKLYIAQLLTGKITSKSWESKIPSSLSKTLFNELSLSQQKNLETIIDELQHPKSMMAIVKQSIFHIQYRLIAWWMILGIVTILTLKGHPSIPYVVMLLPIILTVATTDKNQYIRTAIQSIYREPGDSNWYVMQKYLIGSHMGILTTTDDSNFHSLFQKAFYKQQYLRLNSKFIIPEDYIQFETLSMYYCLYLCAVSTIFMSYFENKKKYSI